MAAARQKGWFYPGGIWIMPRADLTEIKDRFMTDLYPVRRALLSVSDKTGLIELGQAWPRAGSN